MTYFVKAILGASLISLSVGCSNASEKIQTPDPVQTHVSHKSTASPTGYSKPSAAIDFRHDFSGRSTVGAMQTVNLKVIDGYPDGKVEIKIVPSDGIQIFQNNAQASFSMGGRENNVPIQFQVNQEGVHRITVIAVATLGNGQSISRSYAMPVYVGDKYQAPGKGSIKAAYPGDNNLQSQKQSSGGLIVMEAEETITTSD